MIIFALCVLALNCIRLLSRILPYLLEDDEWKNFFWSSLPSGNDVDDSATPLAQSLLNAICVSLCFFFSKKNINSMIKHSTFIYL